MVNWGKCAPLGVERDVDKVVSRSEKGSVWAIAGGFSRVECADSVSFALLILATVEMIAVQGACQAGNLSSFVSFNLLN